MALADCPADTVSAVESKTLGRDGYPKPRRKKSRSRSGERTRSAERNQLSGSSTVFDSTVSTGSLFSASEELDSPDSPLSPGVCKKTASKKSRHPRTPSPGAPRGPRRVPLSPSWSQSVANTTSSGSLVSGELRRYTISLSDDSFALPDTPIPTRRKPRKASRSNSRERRDTSPNQRSGSRERARDLWDSSTGPGEERGVSAKMKVLTAAGGLMPTTRHILMSAVPAPPLGSAWGASKDHVGWYHSRAQPSWVFKALEGVLFHIDTESLWELDNVFTDGQCAVRRMGAAWRSAAVGFAALDANVMLRMCVVQWRKAVVEARKQADSGVAQIMVECMVCLDYFMPALPSRSRGMVRIPGCEHVLCTECLSNYALSATELKQWSTAGVPCPMLGCDEHIAADFVLGAALLTAEQHEALSMHLCRLLMVAPVHCPNPRCNALYEGSQDDEADPHVVCYECRKGFCFACRCAWHTGLTCAQYGQQLGGEDVPLMQLAEEFGWKRCGNCGSMVERLDGCNHVQCTVCSHHFCYRCGGPFDRETYKCINDNCGIFQARAEAAPSQQVVRAVRRLLLFWTPPPLTEERLGFLQNWADTSRNTIDLSLLARGPLAWATLPAWQRQMVQEYRCPYCQHRAQHPHGHHLDALQAHLKRTCASQVYTCCGRVFLTASEMDVHVRDRHQDL